MNPLIEKVVLQKVADRAMFTAYDVSKAVQALQSAAGEQITRHLHMRDDVQMESQNPAAQGE